METIKCNKTVQELKNLREVAGRDQLVSGGATKMPSLTHHFQYYPITSNMVFRMPL
jgi:hypothetical protein